MTARQRSRIVLLLLALAGSLSLVICVFLVWEGEWSQFGGLIHDVPAIWKSPGRRWAYLSRWVLPLALTYGLVFCGSVFFGLRRLRKGDG